MDKKLQKCALVALVLAGLIGKCLCDKALPAGAADKFEQGPLSSTFISEALSHGDSCESTDIDEVLAHLPVDGAELERPCSAPLFVSLPSVAERFSCSISGRGPPALVP